MGMLTDWVSLLNGSSRDPDLIPVIAHKVVHRMWGEDEAHGLKRDLDVVHVAPEALVPITVRRLRDDDVPYILESAEALTPEEKWERASRLRLLSSGVGTCYVAVSPEDVPCYVQWLFSSRDNDFLQRFFHRLFPPLDGDTALLEAAFTPTAFRGQRIMSAAMSRIAEEARSVGARHVITFVGVHNTPSLKGCNRAGFEVYIERTQRWRLLTCSVTFEPVP